MLLPPAPFAQPDAQTPRVTRGRRRDSLEHDQQCPPPPYSPHKISQPDEEHDSPSDPQEAVQQPPPYFSRRRALRSSSPHPRDVARRDALRNTNPRVERLRRFLSFTLAIDYELQNSTPDRISAADWAHFARLAQQMSEACSAADDGTETVRDMWSSDAYPETVMTPALRHQIREPAIALGVHPHVVLVQLFLFVSSINRCKRHRGYASQLEQMPVEMGIQEFGRKLLRDRSELIEAVLPKYPKAMCPYKSLKMQMMVRNQSVIDRWFVRLDKGGCEPRCLRFEAISVQVPVETFEKDTKAVMTLLGLLRCDSSVLTSWKRWKYLAAKRMESRLYITDSVH